MNDAFAFIAARADLTGIHGKIVSRLDFGDGYVGYIFENAQGRRYTLLADVLKLGVINQIEKQVYRTPTQRKRK
jgi:hypothetical protein